MVVERTKGAKEETPTMRAQPLDSSSGAVVGRVLDAIEHPRKEPTTPTVSSTVCDLIHAADSAGG